MNKKILFLLFFTSCFDSYAKANPKKNTPELISPRKTNPKKKWLFLIYMAANNDLYPYASRNIREAARNAPDDVYIIVQTAEPGNKKTKRYLIENKKITLLNPEENLKLDSGNEDTVVDFVLWSIKHYPADHILFDFWDHGTGCLDPDYRRSINPIELFKLNPNTMMLELDRSRGYLSLFEASRGVCFDETYGSYLNNQKIERCLKRIKQETNKKIDIIGFDACLMSMVEMASLLHPYADLMVASQEVELGAGWRYDLILEIFQQNKIVEPKDLAIHITKAYQEAYADITNDYTLSAIDLNLTEKLNIQIDLLAKILIECINEIPENLTKKCLRSIKTQNCFDEPTYIDLKSLLEKFVAMLSKKTKSNKTHKLIQELEKVLHNLKHEYNNTVLANEAGPNINYATGLSIYLPERRIHHSYKNLDFFKKNSWGNFLEHYVLN